MASFSEITAAMKRSREEDEAEIQELRTDRKKSRTLPFRTSPTTRHTVLFSQTRQMSRPPILTPTESSDDESDGASMRQYPRTILNPNAASIMPVDDPTADLDMVDSEPLGSPLWSPTRNVSSTDGSPSRATSSHTTRATTQVRRLSISSTRIPTPIYGHFNISPLDASSSLSIGSTTVETEEPYSKYESPHDLFARRRRLPSPISEDENMESPTTMAGAMLRNLDMRVPTSMTDLCDTEMITPASPYANSFLGSNWRDKRRGAIVSRMKESEPEGDAPEGKIMLSMGFRADCDKCRSRVPGHYSHIVRVS